MTTASSEDGENQGSRFNTTRWSLILSSHEGEPGETKARDALAQLCRIYWRPVFTYICKQGRSDEDAQDLTQEFFLMLLKGNLLQRASPERGRFRSLLLKTLQNFLLDCQAKAQTLKRGGGKQFVSWDQWLAEAPSQLSVPLHALTTWPAERLFDVRWAATVAEQALRRLQEECEGRGRRRVFDALSGLITGERGEEPYVNLARELGVSASDIKRLLHQLRLRYRQLLREEVAGTVERKEEVDAELHYLVTVLAADAPGGAQFA